MNVFKNICTSIILSLLAGASLIAASSSANQAVIKIKGMSCQACVKTVKKSLSALTDVASAEVDVGTATVSSQGGKQLNAEALKAAIEKSGYVVEDVKISN